MESEKIHKFTFNESDFKKSLINQLIRCNKITKQDVEHLSIADIDLQFMNGTVPALDVDCITGLKLIITEKDN